jgi:hypothetical protein
MVGTGGGGVAAAVEGQTWLLMHGVGKTTLVARKGAGRRLAALVDRVLDIFGAGIIMVGHLVKAPVD